MNNYLFNISAFNKPNKPPPISNPRTSRSIINFSLTNYQTKDITNYQDFNDITNKKYLYVLLPDSGPGNQIIAIKEALIISQILDIPFIIPNLHNHHLINLDVINFKTLYKLNITKNILYYTDDMFIKKKLRIYACKNKRFRYRVISTDSLKDSFITEINLNNLLLHNKSDVLSLKQSNENMLILKDLFNNLDISNCGLNGCIYCSLNPNFKEEYKEICSKLDFSDLIKDKGNQFITTYLNTTYIAFHMRYPDDIKHSDTLSNYTNNTYCDYKFIKSILTTYPDTKLFIATNNKLQLHKILNRLSIREKKNIILNTFDSHLNAWIEQYICSKAKVFIEYPINMYKNIKQKCKCSTFSSFIKDYRLYFLNLPESSCVNILNI